MDKPPETFGDVAATIREVEATRTIEVQQAAAVAKVDAMFHALLAEVFSVELDAPDSVASNQGQAVFT